MESWNPKMLNIQSVFTIAKREMRRVSSRFQGGSRRLVIVIFLTVLTLSYLAFGREAMANRGIYRVGISPDSPVFEDDRFIISVHDPILGKERLAKGALDVYIDGDQVMGRNDDRSQYAIGALAQVLQKQEIIRIAATFEIDQAFPLRIEVIDVPVTLGNVSEENERTLSDLLAANGPRIDDTEIQQQFNASIADDQLPELEFAGENVIIPSLSEPPIPFAQVVIAFLYVLPIAFISIFFTSSFMDEKIDKRITVLLAAPVTPLEIILGKIMPYFTFSLLSVILITVVLGGNVLLALAIFTPVIFFIFAIYLIVPLLYRTYKDTTFISMLAVTIITSYLIFPAMFSGVNDFSYMSPLTLAVRMYRQEPFGLMEYMFSAVPMAAIFAFTLYISTRVLNEEFLIGFWPIRRKLVEAVYLTLDHKRPYLSIMLLSLFFIPSVFIIQLITLAISLNLPLRFALMALMITSIFIEELVKSIGLLAIFRRRKERPYKKIIGLSFMSALGFLIGEKLLLYLSLSVVSESPIAAAMFSTGLLLIPLIAHFVFTAIACLLHLRFNVRYSLALVAAAAVHTVYNFSLLGAAL
jgi:ABC-type Na+ efflux pump permease subunit